MSKILEPLGDQRHLFDLPEDVLYFNMAAQGPAPIAAAEAGVRAVGRKRCPWDPERQKLAAEMDQSRELFAGLIGAEGRDIALTTATSYATAVVANNVKLEPGQEILVLEAQFPSNYYVWQKVAKRDDATVIAVPRLENGDWTSAVLERITERTGLVSLPNVHWTDGGMIELTAVSKAIHAVGALFVVDATQSVGALPFDVKVLDPDFVAVSAYKWLLSSDQSGYLYVAPRHQNGIPIEDNHATRKSEASMDTSAGYGDAYADGARRFDQGAADTMIHVPMAVEAMRQIAEWTPERIAASLEPLVDRIAALSEERGWRVPPKAHRSPHFIGALPAAVPEGFMAKTASAKCYISLRANNIRISPYLFNRDEEVDRLFQILDEIF